MKISILGSCRQRPVSKYYDTTSLHDLLTYPHYTKEILQAIRFIKYNDIPIEDTSYVFRTCLINGCRPVLDLGKIKEAYDSTNIFLIEVASMKSYMFNGYYLHHIADDPTYFKHHDQVIKGDLSKEEIEDDIINIRNELHPKKMILVTHFATYHHGKRYELTKHIENVGNKLSIPVLNPSNLLKKYTAEQLFAREAVLSHFTPLGDDLIAEVYKQYIEELIKNEERAKREEERGASY